MKKKSFIPFLGLIIIISSWWFLNNSSAPPPEQGVLDVWATWGDSPEQLQVLFDQFGQSNGISVRVKTQVREEDLLDAMTSTQPPDLVILSSNQLIQAYADQKLIEPLDSWIKLSEINLEEIYPASLEQCTNPENTILCLPWGGDVFALYWNKDLFAAAGLDPQHPPQTMEELALYAKKLSQVDQDGDLVRVGFLPDFSRSHNELYAGMFGGSWLSEDGTKVTTNATPVIKALNWQSQFFERYETGKMDKFALSVNGFLNSNHPVFAGARLNCQQCHRSKPKNEDKIPDHSFYDGKVAMMVDGQWQVYSTYIAHFKPDLNYGIAPFPSSSDHPEQKKTSIVQGPVVVIPAGAADQDMASRLLAWMMSPEIVAEISLANAMLPTNRTAAEQARFQDLPYFAVFMDLLESPNAHFTPASPFGVRLNQAMQNVEKAVIHQDNDAPEMLLDGVQAEFTP